jgi:hypothetical protein
MQSLVYQYSRTSIQPQGWDNLYSFDHRHRTYRIISVSVIHHDWNNASSSADRIDGRSLFFDDQIDDSVMDLLSLPPIFCRLN